MSAQLLVVRSISGAMGEGWLAFIKRSSVFTWLWSRQWERAYGPIIDGIAYRCATLFHPIDDFQDWHESKSLWESFKTQSEVFSLVINGVEYGDLVVDSYLRFMPSPYFNADAPLVRRIIWQVLRDIRQGEKYFKRVKPRVYLSSYSTYVEHGVTARVAMQQGVPVWTFGDLNKFGKRLNSQSIYHANDCTNYNVEFGRLDQQEARLREAEAKLNLRLSGEIDPATSYMRKSAYSEKNSELPQGLDGAVIVFLHDFFDSPHIYPGLVFCDFWRWVCFTIETLLVSGVSFYLKPHPNQIELSKSALTDLRGQYPEAKWLPEGVNNVQLAHKGIVCGVTVYGTVAHELAYLGVPSIACAQHPHHSFEFCRTATNRNEYKAMLMSPRVLPIEKGEMRRQALMFYYMHNLHGTTEELSVRQAFVRLWQACNVGDSMDDEILSALKNLRKKKAFQVLMHDLIECSEEIHIKQAYD